MASCGLLSQPLSICHEEEVQTVLKGPVNLQNGSLIDHYHARQRTANHSRHTKVDYAASPLPLQTVPIGHFPKSSRAILACLPHSSSVTDSSSPSYTVRPRPTAVQNQSPILSSAVLIPLHIANHSSIRLEYCSTSTPHLAQRKCRDEWRRKLVRRQSHGRATARRRLISTFCPQSLRYH